MRCPNVPDAGRLGAVKRRPKSYQLLNRPRHLMKELPHRSKYRKNRSLNKVPMLTDPHCVAFDWQMDVHEGPLDATL
jgi:hypothetical protein